MSVVVHHCGISLNVVFVIIIIVVVITIAIKHTVRRNDKIFTVSRQGEFGWEV